MKKEIVIEKKVFENKNGDNVIYYDMYFILNGQKLNVQFKDDVKKLANYLLEQEFDKE